MTWLGHVSYVHVGGSFELSHLGQVKLYTETGVTGLIWPQERPSVIVIYYVYQINNYTNWKLPCVVIM